MKLNHLTIIAVAAFLGACGGPSQLSRGSGGLPSGAISISDAFRYAVDTEPGKAKRVSVVTGNVPIVQLGDSNLLVVPVILDGSRAHKLIVRSKVARKSADENVLFYALVSTVDAQGQVNETLMPRYEFQFAGNELTNEFALPAGVERVLIHTSPEFYESDFASQTSTGDTSGALGVAAAVGGALGAAMFAATQGKAAGFRFGQVGQITVTVE